jgi:P4 family phage/plasmid primase-like protien
MDVDLKLTDIADTLREDLCWTIGLGWLLWNGEVWRPCPNTTPTNMANRVREELGHAPLAARQIVHQLQACLEVNTGDLDSHTHLLNVQNGVVDLRIGELLPHDPALRLTKMTSVDYDPGARSEAWDQVLSALPADVLQARVGRAMSGTPSVEATVIHGQGPSGKTLFVRALCEALGTHATLILADDQFDLAGLRGVRLAVAEVREVDPARLKRLLDPGVVTARHLWRDSFTFKPSHDLFLVMNSSPHGQEMDEGTRRRIRAVEFEGLGEPDPTLLRRLREPETQRAVLAWAVQAAVRTYGTA